MSAPETGPAASRAAGSPGAGAVPRAAGVRRMYGEIPDRLRSWVDSALGSPVTQTVEQRGGMSPGCATRVVTRSGRRAFVKAVGPELNPMTPDLFRHEARVLSALGADPLWARLLEVYDEPDGWVVLVLEDVEGRHPDLRDEAEATLVLDETKRLVDRLEGCGSVLDHSCLSTSLERFHAMWPALGELPADLLPRWCLDVASEMPTRLDSLVATAAGEHLVHYDIRNDNLLLRDDGSLVFVDWGMSRRGAGWMDPLVVRLEWVEQPTFDELVHRSPRLVALGDEHVTTFLFVFGAWLAHRTTVPAVGLPTMDRFRRTESARLLEGARRRLGIG